MVAEIATDRETLSEIEAHRRELKAAYDVATSLLRVAEDTQTRIGVELQRWDRKVERARQEMAILHPEHRKQVEQLIHERDGAAA